jgi:metallophosphoesterase (TIGR00282 family)
MNLPPQQPGEGYCKIDIQGKTVCVVPLLGRVHMGRFDYDDPFRMIDNFLKKDNSDIYIIDFHAETTSEKKAMGYNLDGRVSAVFGTHTHVQTADEQILPKGTGYITDVGMCGCEQSALGVEVENVISKFKTKMPTRFKLASGKTTLNGVLFSFDNNLRLVSVERIKESYL